jgi:hypothetical protein
MNEDDPYQSWIEKRRDIAVPENFSKKVVAEILRREQAKRQPKPRWELGPWIEWISLRPGMQTAAVALAFAAGALRLILILQLVLSI